MLIKESLEKIPNNPNEKRLGQYLIDQGILLENATVRTVAKEVFLAPSSVVRFVQKLGFKGFNDFKKQYLEEIQNIKVEIKEDKTENNKYKLQNKLNILNEEYKMLVNQKVKELAATNNQMSREIIENTYKELEKEKMQSISFLQALLEKDENKNLKEKVNKLKISIEYFDDVINSEVPNRMILQMLIDKIYINRDKMVKFELKTDIKKMI